MAVTTEDFSGADGTTVVSKGNFIATTTGTATVFQCDGSGNEKIVTATGQKSGIVANTGSADHYAQLICGTGWAAGHSDRIYPLVVGNDGTRNAGIGVRWSGTQWIFHRVSNDSSLNTHTGDAPSAGDEIRLEWSSGVATLKKNGATIFSNDYSSFGLTGTYAGQIQVDLNGTASDIGDDLEVGAMSDLVGDPVDVTPGNVSIPITVTQPTVQQVMQVTPGNVAIGITVTAPTIQAADIPAVAPANVSIPITLLAPTISAVGIPAVTPGNVAIPITLSAPSVRVAGGGGNDPVFVPQRWRRRMMRRNPLFKRS